MRIFTLLIIVLTLSMLVPEAEAIGRRRRRRTNNYAPVSYGYNVGTDQARCQAEANYMAANGIRGHVWGNIAHFEGVGWGGWGCATCVPSGGMILTGDASAQSAWGEVFRVRSWRWPQ